MKGGFNMDKDLESYLVELAVEHGPMTDHEFHYEMDVPAWHFEEILYTLRDSDKFVQDDSERWHLTTEVKNDT